MKLAIAALLVIAGCRRPLKPGETRCYSTPVGGAAATKCESYVSPPPAQPTIERSADGRPIIHAGGDPYCTMVKGSTAGGCGNTLAECESVRDPSSEIECVPWRAAGCFYGRIIITGGTVRMCTPTLEQCDMLITRARNDIVADDPRCYVYRSP